MLARLAPSPALPDAPRLNLFVVLVFVAVYVGMALGRWPGLGLDRTGIALIGGIGLGLAGAVTPDAALAALDFPTLFVLFGLMILSARFAESGFYDWCVARIAAARTGPAALLALIVGVTGILAAVLSNDVVVFAVSELLSGALAETAFSAFVLFPAMGTGTSVHDEPSKCSASPTEVALASP